MASVRSRLHLTKLAYMLAYIL